MESSNENSITPSKPKAVLAENYLVENEIIEFDPFKERKNEHPTTDCETLIHLMKGSLGTGILAMPVAFMYSGIIFGIFMTILTAIICTHCSYVLVECAHTLYRRTHRTAMPFGDVAESAFLNGPQWAKPYATFSRVLVMETLFWAYFGVASVYTVILASNLQQIVEHYTGNEIRLRILIAALLIPLILLSWIPNFKYLAPVSMLANTCMGISLGITIYYFIQDLPPVSERLIIAPISTWPAFFSIAIFAIQAIGVVMPLENSMKTPQNFIGIFGVMNQGMSIVTLFYILLGFLGYLRYGTETRDSITLNLPVEEIPAQIVKILIMVAVFCTFTLQFFVCLEIAWNGIKDKFVEHSILANYSLRTLLVTLAVLLAVAVPTIGAFIGLIGAFCFSFLGIVFPVVIEVVTYWDRGFGKFNWILWKNVLISIFGVLAWIFGSVSAINEIAALYANNEKGMSLKFM